jgi:CRP-like cAMP-binding protein
MRRAARRPPSNHLLAALPANDYQRLQSRGETVSLRMGEVLYEPETSPQYVYFPNDSLVSLVAVTDGGNRVEVGLVGREGMVGCVLALGVQHTPVRAVVQARGSALRVPAAAFSAELERSRPLRREALRYAYVTMATAMQIAACNSAHHLEARLARRLLMTRDRLSTNTFVLTQDMLALILGSRRATVSRAATALQNGKLITYKRGVLRILDAEALRMVSCGCYETIRGADVRRRNDPKNDKKRRAAAT